MSQAPTNISAYFADLSSIAVSFSEPSSTAFNSAQNYYYMAYAVDTSGLQTTYATGSKSPIYILGLSAGTSYNCSVSMVQTASSDPVYVTTLSYPTITDISFSGTSTGINSVSWSGSDISYVKITRQLGTLGYTDICGGDYASPYSDTDISGNTAYSYYVTPYMKKYGPLTTGSASAVVSGRSAVFYARDLSAIFYDASAINVSFTPSTKNNYSTSCSYTLTASGSLYITSVTGASSPLLLQNLSSGTTYTCYIQTTLDSLYTGTSNILSATTSFSSYAKILLVGGGGGGSSGGGGGGSVLYSSTFTFTTDVVYSFGVGSGGGGGGYCVSTNYGGNGGNTILTYGSVSINAFGGGGSNGAKASTYPFSGGSGGGSGGDSTIQSGATAIQAQYSGWTIYANSGGYNTYNSSPYPAGGGGGAGFIGGNTLSNAVAGSGGAGIITDISTTYFGGGGGGSFYASGTTAGSGGSGVGGAGSLTGNGSFGVDYTGSGGGGGYGNNSNTINYSGGDGSTGIVIISVPTALLGTYYSATNVYTSGLYTNIEYKTGGLYIPYKSKSYYFIPSIGTSSIYYNNSLIWGSSVGNTKLLIASYDGNYLGYSSSTNMTSISTLTGYSYASGVGLSGNGRRGIMALGNSSNVYYINWTGQVPTITFFSSTLFPGGFNLGCQMNYDGTRFVIGSYNGCWWGTCWASSSSSPSTTVTQLISGYAVCGISKDGSLIAYASRIANCTTLYVGTWNGSGYTNATVTIPSCTPIQIAVSGTYKVIYIISGSSSSSYYVYYNNNSWTYGGAFTTTITSNSFGGISLSYNDCTLYYNQCRTGIYQIPITYIQNGV